MKLYEIDRTLTAPFAVRHVTQFAKAKHQPLEGYVRRPDWKPAPWVPARPGADDHKQYKSRGV